MKQNWWKLAVVVALVVAVGVILSAKNRGPESGTRLASESSATSLPRMIELGADKCTACKMMKPIVEDLQTNYKDKLDVEFIDVWKDESAVGKYGIKTIPTQIFFDAEGNEFFRHQGFFSKEDILKKFEEHGIKI